MRASTCLLLGALLLPATASAQPKDDTVAVKQRAKELFSQGRVAFKAREFKKALELFRESEAAFPAAGTRLNIAVTLKELGKLAEAMEMLDALVEELPPTDRRHKIAKSTRDAMAKHVPVLTLSLAAGVPANAELLLDGEPITPDMLGVARRMNPGTHTVIVRVTDHLDRRYDISLEPGAQRELELQLGAAVDKDAPPPRDLGVEPEAEADPVLLGLGITALLLGAGGIAGGAVTGAMALSKKSELDDSCPDPALCTQDGVDLASEGQTLSVASTILFIGGGVFATVGVILTIVGAEGTTPTEVAVTPTGVSATIRF